MVNMKNYGLVSVYKAVSVQQRSLLAHISGKAPPERLIWGSVRIPQCDTNRSKPNTGQVTRCTVISDGSGGRRATSIPNKGLH